MGIVEPRQFAWFGLVAESKYSLEVNGVEITLMVELRVVF